MEYKSNDKWSTEMWENSVTNFQIPLQEGQQMPLLGSGGFGSVQFKAGHCGGRHETTPCWNDNNQVFQLIPPNNRKFILLLR